MGTNWDYGPTTFTIEGAIDYLVELRVPHRGIIRTITLEQIGGAGAGNFELFDSYAAAHAVAEQYSPSSQDAGPDSSEGISGVEPSVHSITQGRLPIVAGKCRLNDLKYRYRNRDGSISDPVRKMWMVINSAGAGDKEFALSMQIEMVSLTS